MGRLTPDSRELVFRLRKQRVSIKELVIAFRVSRVTIWFWSGCFLKTMSDLPRLIKSKITVEVEASILFLRQNFKWGTARIQQGLIKLPSFMKEEIELTFEFNCIQDFDLSREAINNILKKHGLNGYSKKWKKWKFFRAKCPNELWQVDLKEFKFEGRKYYLLVVIDDYSRFILQLELFDHCPTTKELTSAMQKLNIKPVSILSDNGGQFREQWKEWCIEQGINPLFAHPYYPQDKGKVERTIRNVSEEFVYLLTQFKKWFNCRCFEEYRRWFNEDRYHRGIKDFPTNLYIC
jgi:hypothetical protein